MHMKAAMRCSLALCLIFICTASAAHSQARNASTSVPRIEVMNCKIEAWLTPDAHEFRAAATITFSPVESTNYVVFELNENLSVQKVLNSEGVELEFGQNESRPGLLSIHYAQPVSQGVSATIRVEYQGGFDRDRYSRIYSRDDSSAFIGMEGTYLMYSAKWFPVSQFPADHATVRLEVTVPLGMTVIGPGLQLPVITKGISETFGWDARTPIQPGSFVAGQYFQKRVEAGDFKIECFSRDDKFDSMQKSAEAAAKILEYYRKAYGPPSSGKNFRLVEVDEQLSLQHGMLGTIFITRNELTQSSPPVRELARRIAYQWWQESIGIKNPGDLWLVDGMSYYSAARYLGNAGGEAAFNEEINELAVLALKFENKSAIRLGSGLGYRTNQYESVVAGKGAWVINMLRGMLGEEKFEKLVHQYIHDCSGKGGSFAVFQKLAEKLYEKELGWFFAEWVDSIGVPTLQVDYVTFKSPNGFRVSGTVRQDQDLFRMPIDIAVAGGGREVIKTFELKGKSTSFDINSFTLPEKVLLDPNRKILRDSVELRTSVQISLGNDLRQKGSFVEAIRAYDNALKLSPHRSLIHYRLAEVFYEQFNLQSAANSFRDALNGDRDPRWIEVWCYIYLGKIYDILGQRQRAMAEYTKAVNTKDDTDGAQAEANKWLAAPFARARTVLGTDKN
jgi:aminopeptidase N